MIYNIPEGIIFIIIWRMWEGAKLHWSHERRYQEPQRQLQPQSYSCVCSKSRGSWTVSRISEDAGVWSTWKCVVQFDICSVERLLTLCWIRSLFPNLTAAFFRRAAASQLRVPVSRALQTRVYWYSRQQELFWNNGSNSRFSVQFYKDHSSANRERL